MKKSITIDTVAYQMLLEVSKKQRMKPDEYINKLIQEQYEKHKR
jgi:macrodomain Ter protein organizer (MatP/YcbG family)